MPECSGLADGVPLHSSLLHPIRLMWLSGPRHKEGEDEADGDESHQLMAGDEGRVETQGKRQDSHHLDAARSIGEQHLEEGK